MSVSKLARENVYKRDCYKCLECGAKDNLTVDHIVPLSRGGTNYFANLQTLCKNCNSKKGNHYVFGGWWKSKFQFLFTHKDASILKAHLENSMAAKDGTVRSEMEKRLNERIEAAKPMLVETINKQMVAANVSIVGLKNSLALAQRDITISKQREEKLLENLRAMQKKIEELWNEVYFKS